MVTIFGPVSQAEPVLDFSKAKKEEIRHSMMGLRDTLVFYRLKDSNAILQLGVGNKDETFPVTGKVHLFAPKVSEEGLKKWINNQHSDGRFVDIPKPVLTKELPKDAAKILSKKATGVSKNPGPGKGIFRNFEVKFQIRAFEHEGEFKVASITDTVKVSVKK